MGDRKSTRAVGVGIDGSPAARAAAVWAAGCPVAVIRSPDTGRHTGPMVAEVDASPDNRAVLGWELAIQLFISGTRGRRSLGWAGSCSVLTVGGAPR